MKKSKIIIIIVVAILIIAAIIASYFLFFNKENKKSAIKLSVNVWPGHANAFIAKEKKYFEKNNVDVELILAKSYTESQNLFLNNKVEGTFEVFADTILRNAEVSASSVVYVSDASMSGDVILAKPEFNSLADLKGKTIGVDGINTFSHIFVLECLKKSGLAESDVFFKNVSANNVLDALEKGEIDAGHTWEPTKTQALAKGYKKIAQASDTPNIITDVLTFKDSIIIENPKAVLAVVKSLLQARDFVETNKEEAIKIMAKAEGMTEQEMAQGLSDLKLPNLQETKNMMTDNNQPDSLFTAGQKIISFYENRGQISHAPDLNQIIDPQFLK